MAGFRSFEEIDAWKLARELTRQTYYVTRLERFRRCWELRSQLRKTARSTMANIAEGFGRGGTREFLRFLDISRGSCSELKSDQYVCLDQGLLDEAEFLALKRQVGRVAGAVAALTRALRHTL